ncbi:uncharacterized protein LOC133740079 isoform X6 [Rosa rugosa]|uniref:uncharacterized protein LOC133740079 isoform X6 n=1 Tax=Rosa rugosa TaxID=74645 RepID=UPI002B405650|nr:uncharacterized protein LOC133740079 isoform X6 [Rosa rugosa]
MSLKPHLVTTRSVLYSLTSKAKGSCIWDPEENRYLDFFVAYSAVNLDVAVKVFFKQEYPDDVLLSFRQQVPLISIFLTGDDVFKWLWI